MNANLPPPPPPPPSPVEPATVPIAKPRRRWFLYGCGGLLGLLLIMVATVAFTIWYIQRPIKPVVLSQSEKAAVDAKLERLGTTPQTNTVTRAATEQRKGANVDTALPPETRVITPIEPDRTYVPGAKVLR